MILKHFDIFTCSWIDITPTGNGSTLEWNEETGWEYTGGYKKYIAQISQSGTDDPTAIVLENTLGFIPDWKRDSSGLYGFDWDGDFVSDNCINYLSPTHNGKLIWIDYLDTYDITLKALDGDDTILTTTIEIRYYN